MINNVNIMDAGLFDFILIDEAHHSAAKTWNSIIDAFQNSKKVLFTATPYRRDKKELPGDIIYSYPIKKASDIRLERHRLFEEGAIWKDIITELNDTHTQQEVAIREDIASFNTPSCIHEDFEDLSLYSLNPKCHVKIYGTSDNIDFQAEIKLPNNFNVVYRNYSPVLSALILITSEVKKLRWIKTDTFSNNTYDLFIIYFDSTSRLLFINASRKSDILYETIARSISRNKHSVLLLYKINRVLRALKDVSFFNVGMKNRVLNNNTESYRIISGSSTQNAIDISDGALYNRGHVFGKGESDGNYITIGYCNDSKVWSSKDRNIPELIDWCKEIATKIVDETTFTTNSGLDHITVGEKVTAIPQGPIACEWNNEVFQRMWRLVYNDGATTETYELTDCDLGIDIDKCTSNNIYILIKAGSHTFALNYSYTTQGFFTPATPNCDYVKIKTGNDLIELMDFLRIRPFSYYFADFTRLQGSEIFIFHDYDMIPYDREKIIEIDWDSNNVDIQKEINSENEKLSIQDYLKAYLCRQGHNVIIFDHGTGEIADFITLDENVKEIIVRLYHCKGSGGAKPGERVGDVYEVCGQVVKCLIWLHSSRSLFRKIKERIADGSTIIQGNAADLERMTLNSKTKVTRYQVGLVQPGISKSELPEKQAQVLSAANNYLRKVKSEELIVIAQHKLIMCLRCQSVDLLYI
jgi:hypothetical protein